MPTVFFLCEELQKHWPSVQLDASSKVSKYTTDLSKIKQVSSSTPNFFFANIYLQNYAHHVDSSHLASSGRPAVCAVPRIYLSYLFSDTERSCHLKLQPFPLDVLSSATAWSQAFLSFQQTSSLHARSNS